MRLYSYWGVPVVIPLVIAFWKAVIDADPKIQEMRTKRKIQQSLSAAKMQATLVALGHEDSRAALGTYGQRAAGEINRRLIGGTIIGTNGHTEPENDGGPKGKGGAKT